MTKPLPKFFLGKNNGVFTHLMQSLQGIPELQGWRIG
jgi:hypothetical protein